MMEHNETCETGFRRYLQSPMCLNFGGQSMLTFVSSMLTNVSSPFNKVNAKFLSPLFLQVAFVDKCLQT